MSEESSTSNESPAPRKGISKGMLSVLGIIAIVLAFLAYDHFIVAPTVQVAFDQIVKKSIAVKMEDGELANTEIHELISKTPSETYEDDFGDTVEVYQWGLPGKKHKMFAIYKNDDGELNFRRHSLDSYSKGDGIVVEANPNATDDEEGGGGMAGGGGGPTEYSAPPEGVEAAEGDADEGTEGDAEEGTEGDAEEGDAEPEKPEDSTDDEAGDEAAEDDEASDAESSVLPSKQAPSTP